MKYRAILALIFLMAVFHGPSEAWAMGEKSDETPKEKSLKSGAQCDLPMSDAELRKILSPEQYRIVRENGTEAAFQNAFWNNKKHGIYVDVVTGEPLFSSTDKFDSGTGWPSFFKPIANDALVEKTDSRLGMARTEVRSKKGGSHLGHVFPDGPNPTGLRYCINSASLRFIPAEDLGKNGYDEYRKLFLTDAVRRETLGKEKKANSTSPAGRRPVAVFGAGCFWGTQSAFENIPGVTRTTVGFMGGHTDHPTYEQVCTHTTGHAEVVRVEYDPSKVSYEKLLETFWSIHDPTTLNRQGPDVGDQYRSAVFTTTPEQEKTATALKQKLQASGKFKKPIVTEISPVKAFFEAEDYHQDYYKKRGLTPQCALPRK